MINDPNLAKTRRRDDDLIEGGIVIDRICMNPIGRSDRGIVQINEFRMIGDNPKVGLGNIEVLNEVIPHG